MNNTMTKEEQSLVDGLRSKLNAIKIMLDRIEDHGGISPNSRQSLSWLLRTGAGLVMASEPPPSMASEPPKEGGSNDE